jgi:hypothetical protein
MNRREAVFFGFGGSATSPENFTSRATPSSRMIGTAVFSLILTEHRKNTLFARRRSIRMPSVSRSLWLGLALHLSAHRARWAGLRPSEFSPSGFVTQTTATAMLVFGASLRLTASRLM